MSCLTCHKRLKKAKEAKHANFRKIVMLLELYGSQKQNLYIMGLTLLINKLHVNAILEVLKYPYLSTVDHAVVIGHIAREGSC